MSDLQEFEVFSDEEACLRWEEIGYALKLGDDDDGAYLDELTEKYKTDEKRFQNVLKKWLRDPRDQSSCLEPATWGHLLEILSNKVGLKNLVKKVEDHLKGTANIVTMDTCLYFSSCIGHTGSPRNNIPVSLPLQQNLSPSTDSPMQQPPSDSPSDSPSDGLPSSAAPSSDSPMDVGPVPENIDFSLKMKEGKTVRKYQHELAAPGKSGENYIFIAPTGSGKTAVSALVISDHLQQCHNQDKSPCHVVFVANTKPLADQQKKQLDELIPAAKVQVYTGDNPGTIADSIKENNHISVCTAGKLKDEIRSGYVKFNEISLMVFDECHHARKGHPYARLMGYYLDHLEKGNSHLPQVIGMTASPGAGDNPNLDKRKTIDHLLQLAATLNAFGGFKTVTENIEELYHCTNSSSCTSKFLKPRESTGDPFITKVTGEMMKLERNNKLQVSAFERWSQEYETKIQQLKSPLEQSCDKNDRDKISTFNLLRCYSNALSVYMELQQKDAIEEIETYTGFPGDDTKTTPHERKIKQDMESLLVQLKQIAPKPNPLLEDVWETLCATYSKEPTSKAIVFVRTKKHASAMHTWLSEHPGVMIQSDVITGHTRETGQGMTQQAQQEVMSKFHKGDINLLIATSVAEEGLDVPECNLVIRFQHVSNEIAKVQTEGRARAENSQGITILSSNSKKKYQELKNKELILLVDDILEKGQIPMGLHLKRELEKFQKTLVDHRRMKANIKKKKTHKNASDDICLRCKKCKAIACSGSEIYTIGDESPHYVVPNQEFQNKIICRPHHKPRTLEGMPDVKKNEKIYCHECEEDWGIKCTWPAKSYSFPILKCKSFTFEINGLPRTIKKWSDVPFQTRPLLDWLKKERNESESSSSDIESD